MDQFDPYLTAIIRGVNLFLWFVFASLVWRKRGPLPLLARRMILLTVVVGMAVLMLGSLTTLGVIAGETARMVYTIYTAFAGLVALSLIIENS